MSVKIWNVFLIAGLLFVCVLGGGILYYNHLQHEMKAQEEQVAQEKRRMGLQAVEDFLNGFLVEVQSAANDYKNTRRVLVNLTLPENLGTPQYREENFLLAQETYELLLVKAQKIQRVFDKADRDFDSLAKQQDAAVQSGAREKWLREHSTKSGLFHSYFESEKDLLLAYVSLSQFYRDKKDVFQVNETNNGFVFQNQEDEEAHAALKETLATLGKAQLEIFALPPK